MAWEREAQHERLEWEGEDEALDQPSQKGGTQMDDESWSVCIDE